MNNQNIDEYCINPGFPVYFSYAGNKDGDPDLEKPIQELRDKLIAANIDFRDYKVDDKSAFHYRRRIVESEEEIGCGKIVVVVFSKKYLRSYHCMYEWYCIVQNDDINNRVFPIYLDGARQILNDEDRYEALENMWKKRHKQKAEESSDLEEEGKELPLVEQKFLNVKDSYKDVLFKIQQYCTDKTVKRLYKFDYNELLNQIKKRIAELVPTASEQKLFAQQFNNISGIKDNYNKPQNKEFWGRKEFTEKLREHFLKGDNLLNLWGVGGVGKTSVAHIYIRDYRLNGNCYDKVLFLTSNNDIENDFCNEIEQKCLTKPIDWKAVLKKEGECRVERLDYIVNQVLSEDPVEEGKKHLLVFDINIVDLKRFENRRFFDILARLCSGWHILILSRPKIKYGKVIQINLPYFDDDLDGAMGLFKDVYKKRANRDCTFLDDDLKWLFEQVFYHPLLIEQLAVFAVSPFIKPLSELKKAVTLDDKRVFAKNQKIDEEGIILDNKNGDIRTIYDYLKNLISFKSFEDHPKALYIVKHFMLWPYEYIPLETILQLLGGKYSDDELVYEDEGLPYLLDRVVLAANDKMQFRMHGALSMALLQDKDEDGVLYLDRFIQNGDYDNYIANISRIGKKYPTTITMRCIPKSLSQYFVADSNLSIYGNCNFWCELRDTIFPNVRKDVYACFPNDENITGLSELDYKVKLLNSLYNHYTPQEIYNRVKTDYNGVSSHRVYYDWLNSQHKEVKKIPSDGVISFVGVDGKDYSFQMIRVDGCMYYIGQTQVTQGLWKAVMGEENLKGDKEGDNYPVYSVSWYDCIDFIIKLNELSGYQFRLPTEAEWEFAASGGERTHNFPYTVYEYAWFRKNANGKIHPVAKLRPNELNIYDMSGNVFEWCQDWYGADYNASNLNSSGPRSGVGRVLRGGCCVSDAVDCGVPSRSCGLPYLRCDVFGLRIALSST